MNIKSVLTSAALSLALMGPSLAQEKETPGVTATEIKIGSTAPLSGPAASLSIPHKVMQAYFKNKKINGRSVVFILADDAYNPAKTVEQTKKLVESDKVAFILGSLGTVQGMSVRDYLKLQEIPQLLQLSGAPLFNDPSGYPMLTPGVPDITGEAAVLANYAMKTVPNGKIAILYQNDDYGKLYLKAFKNALGSRADDVVAEESYEVTNPTIKAQMLKLQNSKAAIFMNISTPKQAIQSLQELKGSDWKPLHLMSTPAAIRDVVFKAAGYDNAKGVVTGAVLKDAADPQWAGNADVQEYKAFMQKNVSGIEVGNLLAEAGFAVAKATEEILKQAGNDLSRQNIARVATTSQLNVPLLIPGIPFSVSSSDYRPYKSMQVVQFDGKYWKNIGGLEPMPLQ